MSEIERWKRLAALTPARIALGRAGSGLPTRETLRFALAHARVLGNQPAEAVGQETSADEEYKRHCGLEGDQDALNPGTTVAQGRAPRGFVHAFHQPRLDRA